MGAKVPPNLARGLGEKAERVPVMMFNEGGTIHVTAFAHGDAKQRWKLDFPYFLPASMLQGCTGIAPAFKPSPGSDGNIYWHLQVTKEDVAKEKWQYVGESVVMVVKNKQQNAALRLTLRRAVNEKTKETLTFFFDRQWALEKIAVVLDPTVY